MSDLAGLLARALAWHRSGRGAVLATVIETWGSAPRPVGSQLLVDAAGAMEGSVSGGCVEGAVALEAIDALADKKARLLEFGVADEDAFAVGLACGGTIRILLEPVGSALPESLLAELVAARRARKPVAYLVDLPPTPSEGLGAGSVDLATPPGPNAPSFATAGPRLAEPPAFADRFRLDRSGVEPDGTTFVAIYNPPLRLFVVGGVHIAQRLIPMAQACGYKVILVEPRTAFGTAERFPGVEVIGDWPDEALLQAGLDRRACIVTLTHDPKLDDPALTVALGANVFYIGALGSTRTHAKRVKRLQEAGFDKAQIARIHAPVGLDIGSRSPSEIALSILAEITQVLRNEKT